MAIHGIFSYFDDAAPEMSFKTVEIHLRCITMADVVSNWLFDTFVLYQVFS